MTATRASIIVVLLVVGGLAVAPITSTAFVGGLIDTTDGAIESDESSTDETAVDVSTFMQASAADADETVDAEMFIAAYERGDNETRTEVVNERTTQLEAKLERLEAEREALDEQEGELNQAAYNAKMASLTVRISSLERAINDTEPRAAAVGADTAALAELRTNASKLSGPEVAELARNVSGIEPPRRPPDGVPGNGVGSGPTADVTDGNESVGPGNSGNANDREPGNETNQNPGQGPEKEKETQNPGQGAEKDNGNQNEGNSDGGPPSNGSDDAESDTGTDTDTETE